jgi:hypothetical protein
MPERIDDTTIGADEVLWRRILPDWLHVEPNGEVRPISYAFRDHLSGELSVHIASIMQDPNRALIGFPIASLAAIRAGYPRSLGYAIVRDPMPDDLSHALICPAPNQGHARKIAKQATWVVLRRVVVT